MGIEEDIQQIKQSVEGMAAQSRNRSALLLGIVKILTDRSPKEVLGLVDQGFSPADIAVMIGSRPYERDISNSEAKDDDFETSAEAVEEPEKRAKYASTQAKSKAEKAVKPSKEKESDKAKGEKTSQKKKSTKNKSGKPQPKPAKRKLGRPRKKPTKSEISAAEKKDLIRGVMKRVGNKNFRTVRTHLAQDLKLSVNSVQSTAAYLSGAQKRRFKGKIPSKAETLDLLKKYGLDPAKYKKLGVKL